MKNNHVSWLTFLKAAAATVGAGALATPGLRAAAAAPAVAPAAVRTRGIESQGVLWGLLYQPHVNAYHRMADLFKQQTGSTVVVQPQPWPLDTKLIASLAAGTQP